LANEIGKCPKCGKELRELDWGYGCSGYQDGCKFAISSEIAHKKIASSDVSKLLMLGETDIIKGFKSAAGKSFDAKLSFDDDHKVVFKFENSEPSVSEVQCPVCGDKMMKSRWSYRCETCNTNISHTVAGKELSEDEMKQLTTERRTDKLDGFTSKAGKSFSAVIVLDDDNRTQFDFS
jgi:DNA topoisomerase III